VKEFLGKIVRMCELGLPRRNFPNLEGPIHSLRGPWGFQKFPWHAWPGEDKIRW